MEIKPEGLDRPGEQAEHRLDPFDRQVAMTMAIIAAVLACVTMLSHRAHDESLTLLAAANRMTTAANIHHTEASDQWGYYQAKNNRSSQLEASLALLSELGKAPGADAKSLETARTWTDEIRKYRDSELPALKIKAEALVKRRTNSNTNQKEKSPKATKHIAAAIASTSPNSPSSSHWCCVRSPY